MTIMSSKNMVMIILENTCVEITSGWYIDSIVKEKTIWVHRPLAICKDVFCCNWVTRKGQKNVLMQGIQIYNYSCTEKRKKKDSSLYRGCKLFLSKDWFEVVRVNCSIASISLFRIDIPPSSKNVQFGAKIARMELNDKVELRKVFRPPHLPLG